jgi:DnaJ-class molecular chaperone
MSSGQSLYDVLGVARDADAAAIRKAYLKMAVQLHPDKNPDDSQASDKFQKLQRVYSILSDPEK